MTEELLVVGAPVAAHWFAERQVGPSLLAYGSEEQKRSFLPGISRGEVVFGIGMSEPDAGSDLASVRTRAEKVDGGWRLTGTKVWTSGAHEADAFFALARSAPLDPAHRHAGLSQFIVDLHAPGVDIRPIVSMGGDHHFNEVHLDGVLVPDERVLGTIGEGWKQVTSELGFERSGPERFLSTYQLLAAAAQAMMDGGLPLDHGLGRQVARVAALHQMSLAVSTALEAHARADLGAAAVKVLGTTTEGDIADYVDLLTASGWIEDEELHGSCTARSSNAPASRCGAAPTKSCAASSPAGWACADDDATGTTTTLGPPRGRRPRSRCGAHRASSTTTAPRGQRPSDHVTFDQTCGRSWRDSA